MGMIGYSCMYAWWRLTSINEFLWFSFYDAFSPSVRDSGSGRCWLRKRYESLTFFFRPIAEALTEDSRQPNTCFYGLLKVRLIFWHAEKNKITNKYRHHNTAPVVLCIKGWTVLPYKTAEGEEYTLEAVCDALRHTNERQLCKQDIRMFIRNIGGQPFYGRPHLLL
jgi:hypothetical protein